MNELSVSSVSSSILFATFERGTTGSSSYRGECGVNDSEYSIPPILFVLQKKKKNTKADKYRFKGEILLFYGRDYLVFKQYLVTLKYQI